MPRTCKRVEGEEVKRRRGVDRKRKDEAVRDC
jgi:hypothetical protein